MKVSVPTPDNGAGRSTANGRIFGLKKSTLSLITALAVGTPLLVACDSADAIPVNTEVISTPAVTTTEQTPAPTTTSKAPNRSQQAAEKPPPPHNRHLQQPQQNQLNQPKKPPQQHQPPPPSTKAKGNLYVQGISSFNNFHKVI